jgi:predicted GH43/DUF377 family glycosyl hydrolase
MLLDLKNPAKVTHRAKSFILQPEAYYERFWLYIPDVVFPTAAIVKDGLVYIYYGVCDTAISLITVKLSELLDFVQNE